jgi:predicted  nucleic acid-binding Zn-ribbon protein
MRLAKWMPIGVGLLIIAFGAFGASTAAQGTGTPDVLGALLTEVRGLRVAMEQVASSGPRVQLALGRLQLQEQRLNTMIRRAEGMRDTVARFEREVTELQSEISGGETMLKSADPRNNDEAFVRSMNQQIRDGKRRLALQSTELQRLQGEESALQQQIAGEQARWAEINRMLEELERTLGKRGGV